MISNSIRPLLFHILFTTAIGNISVKILQINLSNGFYLKCNNDNKCHMNGSDIMSFFKSIKPDVVLWLSDLKIGYDLLIQTIKPINTKVIILPIVTYIDSLRKCYDFPSNFYHRHCYYSKYLPESKLEFLILNTLLWIKEIEYSNVQLQWLDDKLRKARAEKKQVMIVGYKAPVSLELSNGVLNYTHEYNEKFVNLLVTYSSIIKGCIFGDEIYETFRIIKNNDGKPVLPIFISPSSTNEYVKLYTYNQSINELDNCFAYYEISSDWKELYNCRKLHKLSNMNASSWFKVAQSILYDNTDSLNLSGNNSVEKYCKNNNFSLKNMCVKCKSNCFIDFWTKEFFYNCMEKCTLTIGKGNLDGKDNAEQNSGLFSVFGVMAGFVIILVGIVLAVNKVYCIRRGRQRNIFLAPLTLNIQAEIPEDSQNSDIKGKSSKNDVDNQIKNSNGFRRTNHEVEQTYNYIRM